MSCIEEVCVFDGDRVGVEETGSEEGLCGVEGLRMDVGGSICGD